MIKKRILIAGMATMFVLLTGCASPQPNATPTPLPGLVVTPVPAATPTPLPTSVPELSPDATLGTPVPGELTAAPGTGAADQKDLESAKAIQADVDKLSEIAKSSVLVMGDTALVGVQFESQYKGELTTRIRDMIIKRAEAVDSAITKVAVTADAAQFKRVEDMATRVKEGAPFSEISLEMSELVNGLLPRG